MPTETEGGAPAAPDSTSTATGFEETVLSLLNEMSQRLSAQEQEIAALKSQPSGPAFVGPAVHANAAKQARYDRAENAPRDGVPRSDTIPIFPNGERVPEMVMRRYTPRYGTGDIVQLNLSAYPHGRDDKTRGELMGEKNVPNGYGEILSREYLSEVEGLGWRYRVQFDKTVMPGSNGGIVHLFEPELLPA
jgi:hypothetical protein